MKFKKSRRCALAASTILTLGAMTRIAQAKAPSPTPQAPNIVFILADDMGYADLSITGQHRFRTPAIDSIGSKGIVATQAYAPSPVCSASRTALLTGQYNDRFAAGLDEPHVAFDSANILPTETPTLAGTLKSRGYETALIGKWHVGALPDHSPLHYGYDYFFGIAGGAADYFDHSAVPGDRTPENGLWENSIPVHQDGYLTDIIGAKTVAQINKPHDKPFFFSVHFNAPHWPWEGPEDSAWPRMLEKKKRNIRFGGSVEKYAEMMQNLDRNVGRILAALKSRHLDRNTIVIFTSDNGAERYSDTWPYVGYKSELLEGGIRIPFLMRWPGHIKPHSTTSQVLSLMDMAPVFEAVSGASEGHWDGLNLLPQLQGQAGPVSRELFWRFNANAQQAVRRGDWKYERLNGKEGLFNLHDDPRERTDLKEDEPEIFETLKADWQKWNAEMLPYRPGNFTEDTHDLYSDRF